MRLVCHLVSATAKIPADFHSPWLGRLSGWDHKWIVPPLSVICCFVNKWIWSTESRIWFLVCLALLRIRKHILILCLISSFDFSSIGQDAHSRLSLIMAEDQFLRNKVLHQRNTWSVCNIINNWCELVAERIDQDNVYSSAIFSYCLSASTTVCVYIYFLRWVGLEHRATRHPAAPSL